MVMASWILGMIAYLAYMLTLFHWPPDILLAIALAALILGAISQRIDKRVLLLFAFLLMFGGVVFTFGFAWNRESFSLWVVGAAAQVFFGSLSLRK